MNRLETTISALVHAIAEEHVCGSAVHRGGPYDAISEFVAGQVAKMAAPLRLPLCIATHGLSILAFLGTGEKFHRLPVEARKRLFRRWRASRVSAVREISRFYESLTILALYGLEQR